MYNHQNLFSIKKKKNVCSIRILNYPENIRTILKERNQIKDGIVPRAVCLVP